MFTIISPGKSLSHSTLMGRQDAAAFTNRVVVDGVDLLYRIETPSKRVFPQYKNVKNIANFVLDVSFKINKTNEVYNL